MQGLRRFLFSSCTGRIALMSAKLDNGFAGTYVV